MSELNFMGLDVETTGSDRPPVYQLIQIGVSTERGQAFVSDVGHDAWSQNEDAMAVNGFTLARIMAGPRAPVVDSNLELFFQEQGVGQKRGVAIGWNVGSFDLPFVQYYLPAASKYLSYRTIDLNAVCFTIARAKGMKWLSVKDAAKRAAEKSLGGEPKWHDALYDAQAALESWKYLTAVIAGQAELD